MKHIKYIVCSVVMRNEKERTTMGRPASKTDLLSAAAAGYEELNQFIASMTE